MKRIKGLFALVLGIAFVLSVAGATVSAEQADTVQNDALAMDTVISTVDGYSSNGGSQIRTTESLTGEYSVLYSVNGATPNNGWIAQQYIGLGEDNSYLQINLFVDSAITVSKVTSSGTTNLPILDPATNEPVANPRSYELGGAWFPSPDGYIFKYEVTETRLNLYCGSASAIVSGTDAPVSRGYVALDAETYGVCTDGIASFAPYAADRVGFDMTVNYITVDGTRLNIDMSAMEATDDPEIIANDDITVFGYEDFENINSSVTNIAAGDTFRKAWVSELPVNTADLPEDADVFTTSFDINLTTPLGGYIPSGLQFGLMLGMPAADSPATTDGVTSITGNLPYGGLNVYTGNGSELGTATPVGNQQQIFCADQGMSTISLSLVGKKDGTLTIAYSTNLGQEAAVTLQDVAFDGYFSFYVEANNVAFQKDTSATLSFQNVRLPATKFVEVESITLSESNISVPAGQTHQLTATVKPDNATVKTVTWTSSDEDVASVDNNGLITAKTPGSTTITVATENGFTATCSVLVPVEAESVTLDKTSAMISVGREVQLTATILPDNTDVKTLTWESSAPEIAMVNNDGLVTGVAVGNATITVKTSNGKTAVCEITVVVGVESVTLDQTEATLDVGGTVTLTATVLPENAGNKNVTWHSSAENVATVENGVVTAKAAGTAVISVLTEDGNKEATCTVTVKAPVTEVTGVTLDQTEATLDVGGTVILKATVAPQDATDPSVTWKSSDTSIAVVNENGVVTAVKAGTATITVTTANGKTATCTITVNGDPDQAVGCGCGSIIFGSGSSLLGAGGAITTAVSLMVLAMLRKRKSEKN